MGQRCSGFAKPSKALNAWHVHRSYLSDHSSPTSIAGKSKLASSIPSARTITRLCHALGYPERLA